MYEGYAKFGGIELVNAERLRTYAEGGYVPDGVDVNVCEGDCEGMWEALGEPTPYTSPAHDQPPWYDPSDPDSLDFAGVVPLGFSGLSGSTRKVPMNDRLLGGAVPGRPRPDARTIQASALLVGRTSCSTEVGLSWLTSVLHQVCTDAPSCRGTTLEMFTCCPAPVCDTGSVNPDQPLETFPVPMGPDWIVSGGTAVVPDDINVPLGAEIRRNYAPGPTAARTTAALTGDTTGGTIAATGIGAGTVTGDTTPFQWTWGLSASVISAVAETITGLTIGQQYTYTAYIRGATGGPGVRLFVNTSVVKQSEIVPADGLYHLVSIPFVATAVTHRVGVRAGAATNVARVASAYGFMVRVGDGLDNTTFETDASNWAGNSVFGSQTLPQAIASSTDRAFEGLRSLKATWPNLTAGTNASGVYQSVDTPAHSVWTFRGRYYVPSGNPDLIALALFLNDGGFLQAKDQWADFKVTASGPNPSIFFGVGTANYPGNQPVAGQVGYIDDVVVVPGDGTDANGGVWFEGDSAAPGVTYGWAGTPGNSQSIQYQPSAAFVATSIQAPYGEFYADWQVTPFTLGTSVRVVTGAVSADGGTVLYQRAPVDVTASQIISDYYVPTPGDGNWRPAIWVASPGANVTLSVQHIDVLNLDDCVDPYKRIYTNVSCVDGPTITEEIPAGCDGKLIRVEWTWVAGDPWRYGVDEPLVTDKGSNTAGAVFVAQDVNLALVGTVTQAATACVVPGTVTSCAADPCCIEPNPPPAAPNPADPCIVAPVDYTRTVIQMEPGVVPNNSEAALTFTLKNDAEDKLGVRLRMWQDPTPDLTVPVECDFVWEAMIPYIPPNQTVVIDGVMQQNTVTCQSLTTLADPHIRGAYGAGFEFPVVKCGQRYLIAVDVPRNYQKACAGQYALGASQGNLLWSVDMAVREG